MPLDEKVGQSSSGDGRNGTGGDIRGVNLELGARPDDDGGDSDERGELHGGGGEDDGVDEKDEVVARGDRRKTGHESETGKDEASYSGR